MILAYKNERSSIITCACVALLALLLVGFANIGAAKALYTAWQADEYSHGIIVPFIALLLVWHRLTIVRPAVKPSWWGPLVLAVSGVLLLAGALTAFETAAEYGLILSLVGLSLAFLGKRATRTMLPGFVYLFFAVPLPHIVYANLSQDLQLFSSTCGVWFLDICGIPVFQEGNVIDLGGYKLQVAEACSGLRYLFPLMSFGYLVAYLLEDRWWKRAVIFFSTIPITILMNSLRIALIGVTVDIWGNAMAEGFVHEFEGWVVFLLCVGLLLVEVWLLLPIGTRGRFRLEYLGLAYGPLFSGHAKLGNPGIVACVLAAILAVTLGNGRIENRVQIAPEHPAFATFPLMLGNWHGHQDSLDEGTLAGLQLSDYWLADYASEKEKAPVNFYMAYYARQSVASQAHSPANCIPGGGWQIKNASVKTLTLPDDSPLSVARMLIRRGDTTQLAYFWFDERGRDVTDTYQAKWFLLLDSLKLGRSDGALVRLITPVMTGESEEAADERLEKFLAISLPFIHSFIPGGAE